MTQSQLSLPGYLTTDQSQCQQLQLEGNALTGHTGNDGQFVRHVLHINYEKGISKAIFSCTAAK